ncbi:alpha/beta hydrolase [Mycolicibacterium wolinskyi]|uniref:AB hydrolase-1 domain-containing protein n=1 Tax=Mycolicibacterium wolinskyi TaxID=59750 RepID=A0A1X2F290_9MYCO|nr:MULTISPECIES: alpha/beta hydrolase [Mycolicibacterium]MCV7287732.1 alpha/beta hydrolase [Mycolicibacterium wolinskyi]MCV7294630.1 alpha/beta hydrolase [Mycolicibacterium goodii]ORX12496.1 hypothetical protein AWC31_31480 [Mycolicibacterium wolinskyi]
MNAAYDHASEGSAEIGGIRWAYTDRGNGPLVVFLHGTFASGAMYQDVILTLQDRYRCVAVDLPGHGRSGFNPDGWTLEDVVEGVGALISTFDAGPATLVGLSQGGAVAMRVALRYPTLVGALVTQGAGPDGPAREAVDAMAAFGRALAEADGERRRAAAVQIQPAFHASGWVQAHPQAAEQELSVILRHDRRAVALVAQVPGTADSIEEQLNQITCPSLIMWGDEDPRAFWGPKMVAAMPAAQLVIVEHAGHHLNSDAPEVCAREIGRFLDEVHAGHAAPQSSERA